MVCIGEIEQQFSELYFFIKNGLKGQKYLFFSKIFFLIFDEKAIRKIKGMILAQSICSSLKIVILHSLALIRLHSVSFILHFINARLELFPSEYNNLFGKMNLLYFFSAVLAMEISTRDNGMLFDEVASPYKFVPNMSRLQFTGKLQF